MDASLDFLVIGNMSSISVDTIACPSAHFADGAIDVCFAIGCSTINNAELLLGMDTGVAFFLLFACVAVY